MAQQPMMRNERLKKLVKMRIDSLKKMGTARQSRAARAAAAKRTRTV